MKLKNRQTHSLATSTTCLSVEPHSKAKRKQNREISFRETQIIEECQSSSVEPALFPPIRFSSLHGFIPLSAELIASYCLSVNLTIAGDFTMWWDDRRMEAFLV